MSPLRRRAESPPAVPFPGSPALLDGREAVAALEAVAGSLVDIDPAAGALPLEGLALLGRTRGADGGAAASGAALAGLRAAHFAAGEGLAALRAPLAAAAGRHLPWVLHAACRATTRHGPVLGAGHDDYHALSDSGAFQLFARDAQAALDLGLIAHRIAELALLPGVVAQDEGPTSRTRQSLRVPEPDLASRFLGAAADVIETPTPSQRLVFGERRRRVPIGFDVDEPALVGARRGPADHARAQAAERPFFAAHVAELTDRACAEFSALTGRAHARAAGHGLDDARLVLVAQGSLADLAISVAARLREERGLRVGVLELTMLRPFPADRVTRLLAGKAAVTVLERCEHALSGDPPLLREIRSALLQAVENARRPGETPHLGLVAIRPNDLPELFGLACGLGGAEPSPGDVVAAVENMLPKGPWLRHGVAGVEFTRPSTRLPKLQIRQEQVVDAYPSLASANRRPAAEIDVLPELALALRVLSTTDARGGALAEPGPDGPCPAAGPGRNHGENADESLGATLARAAGRRLGVCARTWLEGPPARLAQPLSEVVLLAPRPLRHPGRITRLAAIVAQDARALARLDRLDELAEHGLLLVGSPLSPEAAWDHLPRPVQHALRARSARLACVEATGPLSLLGALLGLTGRSLPAGDDPGAGELERGRLAARAIETREFEEVGSPWSETPACPPTLHAEGRAPGPANPGPFWEADGFLSATGGTALADPWAATGALPARSVALRDLSSVRRSLPLLRPDACTGCGECWTQCPDGALRAQVVPPEALLTAALGNDGPAAEPGPLARVLAPLGREAARRLRAEPRAQFGTTLHAAYTGVADRLGLAAARRAELDEAFATVAARLADYPAVRCEPFFDAPESREKNSGGLLSLALDPRTCQGCGLCVRVCPENALQAVPQQAAAEASVRAAWSLRARLPDTDPRFVDGTVATLLLRRACAEAMLGGDPGCAGCGEKSGMRLVLAAVQAAVAPRVAARVREIDTLIEGLDARARGLVAGDVDLAALAADGDGEAAGRAAVDVRVERGTGAEVRRLASLVRDLRALRARYEGPAGGRAALGAACAGGCVAAWAGTWPWNPWPFPWTQSLVADAPALAGGLFEGHAQRMAADFSLVRRARFELADGGDRAEHEAALARFGWRDFDDEEFALCPPVLVTGGDGALGDEALAALVRLLAGDRPLRVVLLDNQLRADAGGVAGGTSPAVPGARARVEPALLGLAQREAFVLSSSPAAPAHLLSGLLRGLASRRPALFVLHATCPWEHGHAADHSPELARLAIAARVAPLLGPAADPAPRRSPSPEELATPADWALPQARFHADFTPLSSADAEQALPLAEYLELPAAERTSRRAFVVTRDAAGAETRLAVSDALVRFSADRRALWSLLRQLAGEELPDAVRRRVSGEVAAGFEAREAALRDEHEQRVAALKAKLPTLVARRLAAGLLREEHGSRTVAEIVTAALGAPPMPTAVPTTAPGPGREAGSGQAAPPARALAVPASQAPTAPAATTSATPTAAAPAPAAAPVGAAAAAADEAPEPISLDPWIESARCTTCNECTNLNKRMFAYNEKKQATIKDPSAGTFAQLVQAAEKCPVRIIHPGSPRNPDEKNLDKWLARAAPFNT